MTGLDLISGALRLVGVGASGEVPSANESQDALNALNAMIDSWSNEQLMIPNKVREVFPFVGSQGSYTMGSSGNFNTTRPMKIETAILQLSNQVPVTEIPMYIMTKDQWAGILVKQLTSNLPLYLYAEGTFPLDTINVWPVPVDNTNSLVLYSWKPLTQLASTSVSTSLPPGYDRALRFNLAIELASEYGREVPMNVTALAMESKSVLKRMNTKPQYLQVDDALKAKPAVWNWRIGDVQ